MPSKKTTSAMRLGPRFGYVLVFIGVSSLCYSQVPSVAQQAPTVTSTDAAEDAAGPPEGMTLKEWNRTAVKELRADSRAGRARTTTAEERRGIFAAGPGVETVQDSPDAVRVYPIETLVNHATLIQVPGTVLKAWCGDLQGWTLEGESNYVSIKPLAGGLSTNLHVLTTDGRMVNFRLTSNTSGNYTDVFQVRGAGGYQADIGSLVDQRVAAARKDLESDYAKKLDEAVSQAQLQWVRDYAGKTFFDYAIEEGRTFKVEGVFNDGTFTYFRVRGDEKPIIFLESKQGWKWVREVINFNVTDGDFYRVQKLLEPHQRFVLKLRDEEATISRRGA